MKIHFIGIGGIGVSALAQYYLAKRHTVSGSDLRASEITEQLQAQGITISTGDPNPSLVTQDIDLVVFSPAIPENHAERQAALRQGIEQLSYPQALGRLTREHTTITVSGCHGKSTTTSMIGILLAKARLNPTVIVGTKVKEFESSNFRMGGYPDTKYKIQDTKYLVIEADEHFGSFLNYNPTIAVVTNIERDHLDYYKTLGNIKETFKTFIAKLPKEGTLVINKDDAEAKTIVPKKHPYKTTWYTTKGKDAKALAPIMRLPGQHNLSNAMATLQVARILNIPDKVSFTALSAYQGSWRRFEIFSLKNPKPYTLISDYGHHPTEVRVTVQAAREKWPAKKIWLVFQPHQYQRTYYLWKDFVQVLSTLPVEKLILLDIYDVAGREETSIKKKVSSEKLAKAIDALYSPTIQQVEHYLQRNLQGGEIVMVMGAGDIYNLTLALTREHPKGKIQV
ncbi:MAG: hypothetical protein A3C82_01295 [Candidatus Wildermuthbacteria bacterium RIFCSPHIGHO2_02_FULL_47_12]|uniref:UDP-N-acetylmuramate--L-alanine ligase n=2 Tax=Parcubacteria group TaxID=1794811 RepID=A0A1G2R1N0_9BACT|nr:MAG: hypothetical protein A3A24_03560 [Candidatus Buchananbacteria bacterium RIFCSPLOWO2_01_FULL_46_12]OHA66740.1 MAG: hypothetical protein A3C82_01295 [Candidatus Wildermuthbacteria bacterium RIFCSPHIGHO2_02_FULL_47_12]